METTLHVRMNRDDLLALLRSLPAVLAGNAPDPHGLARGFRARLAFAFLSQVKEALEVKGRGGTGSDGITWEPLAERTADRKATKGMSQGQRQRYRDDYRASLGHHAGRMSMPEARQQAEEFATGRHEQRVGRTVSSGAYQIMVDTGVLRQSLSIGTLVELGASAEYHPADENQVYRENNQEVIVGSNVPYARWQHGGTRHIPARPFWPEELPEQWEREIVRQAKTGLERIVDVIVGMSG